MSLNAISSSTLCNYQARLNALVNKGKRAKAEANLDELTRVYAETNILFEDVSDLANTRRKLDTMSIKQLKSISCRIEYARNILVEYGKQLNKDISKAPPGQ